MFTEYIRYQSQNCFEFYKFEITATSPRDSEFMQLMMFFVEWYDELQAGTSILCYVRSIVRRDYIFW